jgi:hypothetical protein
VRRRKKRPGGLSGLAKIGEEAFVPPIPVQPARQDIIKVEAESLAPIQSAFDEDLIDDYDEPADCGLLSLFMGGKKNLPPNMTYKVETDGKSFADKRMFSYSEEGGKWRLTAGWTAEGVGPVPHGIKMLGGLQGIFNQCFNMMLGGRVENQRIQHNAAPEPSKGIIFKREDT